MLGQLLRFLVRTAFRLLVFALTWVVRATVWLLLHLAPPFFHASVYLTGRLLVVLDRITNGWLSRRTIVTAFASALLWVIPGWALPLVGSAVLDVRPMYFCLPAVAGGFVFGFVCGMKARRLPGWGTWLEQDGLQLGEKVR